MQNWDPGKTITEIVKPLLALNTEFRYYRTKEYRYFGKHILIVMKTAIKRVRLKLRTFLNHISEMNTIGRINTCCNGLQTAGVSLEDQV